MAIYYSIVFALLVVEMVLFALLTVPLPVSVRRPLLRTISTPFHNKEVNIAIKCILVFILILFVDSVNRTMSLEEELRGFNSKLNTNIISTDRSDILARKFYSQRNLYLTGFTLFLTLILTRTYDLVHEYLSLKDSHGANEKLLRELHDKNEKLEILQVQVKAAGQPAAPRVEKIDPLAKSSTGVDKR